MRNKIHSVGEYVEAFASDGLVVIDFGNEHNEAGWITSLTPEAARRFADQLRKRADEADGQ